MKTFLALVAILLVVPASAGAKGTWTSSDFKQLTVTWQTDDGSTAHAIRIAFTKNVSAVASRVPGVPCSVISPMVVGCTYNPDAATGDNLDVTLADAADCADSFGLTVSADGRNDTTAQNITSGNTCGPPPPPPPPPTDPTGTPGTGTGVGAQISPPLLPIVTGPDAGAGPQVKVFDGGTLDLGQSFFAYTSDFHGGVRVAEADVNGDKRADVITGAGAGGGPHVKVFDGANGSELRSFYAYDAGFTGGVFVAAGDVNGDGKADIITGAGAGAGPQVKVFDGTTGSESRSFFAGAAGFTGGVRVAAGDVDGDGKADIITGEGTGGGVVRVYSGASGAVLKTFMPYAAGFTGGVFVAAGDVNGDGVADIVTGPGSGGSNVRVFDGKTGATLQSFNAFASGFAGGVRVAAGDVNGDGVPDVVAAPGSGAGPNVRVFDGKSGATLRSFFAYDASFTGGVFVAATSAPAVPPPTKPSRVNAKGILTLGLSCPSGALGACDGSVRLTLGFKASPRAAAAKVVVLGSGSFKLKPGKKGKPKVKLNRSARALLVKKRKLVATATVTTVDRGGNKAVSVAKVTLR